MSARLISKTPGARAAISAMQPTADGHGKKRVVIAHDYADIEIWLDIAVLVDMYADRAIRSKGKRARVAKGGIEIKAKNVNRVPVA